MAAARGRPPPTARLPTLTHAHAHTTSTGFIGVGQMGSAMAGNLLRAGWRLVVCDRSDAAVAPLVQLGAARAASPAELATNFPGMAAIVSMLPTAAHVKDAYLGPAGVLAAPALHPHCLVDCSTVDPITSQELAAAAERAELHPDASAAHDGQRSPLVLDAPVSGGVKGAAAGTLTFMCGGTLAALEAARPVLLSCGKAVIHCGPAGAGQAAKIANNLVLASR